LPSRRKKENNNNKKNLNTIISDSCDNLVNSDHLDWSKKSICSQWSRRRL